MILFVYLASIPAAWFGLYILFSKNISLQDSSDSVFLLVLTCIMSPIWPIVLFGLFILTVAPKVDSMIDTIKRKIEQKEQKEPEYD